MSALAPIALFVYKRLWHTKQILNALIKNKYAENSRLIIFSDGAKNEKDQIYVSEVRRYLEGLRGFKEIEIIKREKNYGLAESIIYGVTKVVSQFGKIIVLEDDLLTSPYFLEYMNEALDIYKDKEKVISIHGYTYPIKEKLPETFFLKGADCWGWGTWDRGWKLFENDSRFLYNEIIRRGLENEFNYNGSANYIYMLKNQIEGKIDSWAIRWYASAFLKDKLTLYPGHSLVKNIGMDSSGTHTKKTSAFDVHLSESPVNVKTIPVVEDKNIWELFLKFHLSTQSNQIVRFLKKIKNGIKS